MANLNQLFIGWQDCGLDFKPLTADDWAVFSALYCNQKTMRRITAALPVKDAFQLFTRTLMLQEKQKIIWLVIRNCSDQSVFGLCGIPCIKPCSAEVGIMLLPEAHGKHIALNALASLARKAFYCLSIKMVYSKIQPQNYAAQRLVRLLGFELIQPHGPEQYWQLDSPPLPTFC